MKSIRRTWPVVLALVFWLAVPAKAGEEFQYRNFNEALKLAEAENKLVMVFFWAEWCGYCIQIRREVFTDPRIHEVFNRDFLAVSVDIEDDPEDLAKKYRARALPTMIFLKPDGEVMGFLPGAVNGETFLKVLDYLVENRES